MAGDKYKLKITNIGIGDPFILIKAHFEDSGSPPDGGSWTLPSETSIDEFSLLIALSETGGNNLSNYIAVGHVSVVAIGTENEYYFGLPFDQGNFTPGSDLWVMLLAQDANGNSYYLYGDNEYDSHLAYVQKFAYMDTPVNFQNIMVYYNWVDS